MFDFKLLDIIQSVSIGFFTLALIIFFYFLFNKCLTEKKFDEEEFFKWLKDDILRGSSDKTGYVLVITILIYFLGVITSDLTERMTDSSKREDRNIVLNELNDLSWMYDIQDLRTLTLVNNNDSLTSLGKSILRTPSIVIRANNKMGTNFFLGDSAGLRRFGDYPTLIKQYKQQEDFKKFVSEIYYTSKNWCFSQKDHEPLVELKSIQGRIDLARSTVLLSTVAWQVLILIFVAYCLMLLKSYLKNGSISSIKPNFNHVLWIVIHAFSIFVLTVILCRECFRTGLMSYNKRAFGYYVSHVNESEEAATKSQTTLELKNSGMIVYDTLMKTSINTAYRKQ